MVVDKSFKNLKRIYAKKHDKLYKEESPLRRRFREITNEDLLRRIAEDRSSNNTWFNAHNCSITFDYCNNTDLSFYNFVTIMDNIQEEEQILQCYNDCNNIREGEQP